MRFGFDDGFRLGGKTLEVKHAGSSKILYLLERVLSKDSTISISSFREVLEPCKEFFISVNGVFFVTDRKVNFEVGQFLYNHSE